MSQTATTRRWHRNSPSWTDRRSPLATRQLSCLVLHASSQRPRTGHTELLDGTRASPQRGQRSSKSDDDDCRWPCRPQFAWRRDERELDAVASRSVARSDERHDATRRLLSVASIDDDDCTAVSLDVGDRRVLPHCRTVVSCSTTSSS